MKKLWLLPLAVLALHAADINGKWTGSVEVTDPTSGEKINTPIRVEFTQKAADVSGAIGRAEESQTETIRQGKLEGNQLVFEVKPPEATGAMKFKLVLVSDDRIEGDMQGAIDVGNIAGKVVLTRVK